MFKWIWNLIKKLFVVKKGSYKGSLDSRSDDLDDFADDDMDS